MSSALDDPGLVLVPYSGWSAGTAGTEGCVTESYLSGVQLVDWEDDALELRASAPVKGNARRGLLHGTRLLTVSDDRVESFDIDDRDQPIALDGVALALHADFAAVRGRIVTRFGHDWYTGAVEVTVSSLEDVNNPDRGTTLSVPEVDERQSCDGWSYLSQFLAAEHRTYLLCQRYEYDSSAGKTEPSQRIVTIETQDGESASLVGDAEIGTGETGYIYGPGLVGTVQGAIARGDTVIP